MDALAQYTRAETARRGADDLARENQLHPVGPPQVEVVADDFFEKLPTGQRPIHDLGEAELHLPDAQSVTVAGLAVSRAQGQRQAVQPLVQEGLDVLGTQLLGQSLKPLRVVATQKAIIQVLEADALLGQLPLEPFVAVE